MTKNQIEKLIVGQIVYGYEEIFGLIKDEPYKITHIERATDHREVVINVADMHGKPNDGVFARRFRVGPTLPKISFTIKAE